MAATADPAAATSASELILAKIVMPAAAGDQGRWACEACPRVGDTTQPSVVKVLRKFYAVVDRHSDEVVFSHLTTATAPTKNVLAALVAADIVQCSVEVHLEAEDDLGV